MHAHGGASSSAHASSTCRVQAVIKLGGAAITVKQKLETPRPETISAVAQHIKEALSTSKGSVVVVHGAGSFGHQQASTYRVAQGPLTDPDVHRGFAITRASVTKLNNIVVESLVQAGVPAVGISPFGSGWSTSNRQVTADGISAVEACLAAGMVPVLHGDAVLDAQLGCTILSGDTIVARLAERLQPERVVFLTNVAGVYDRPPEEEGAQLLHSIAVQPDGSWQADVRLSVAEHDVTGGMGKKIQEAAMVAACGMDVVIAGAGTAAGRQACVMHPQELRHLGSKWEGTIVHADSRSH